MRNYFTAIFALFMTINVMAQPQAFKYQTVVRDSEGEIVANQTVSFQMKILQGSPAGTEVYAETHTATTNQFGLANLEIGNGTVVSGDFETIDWGADDYFIEISFDITGGTDYLLAGTSQLMAVPYALYAKESGSGSTWEAGEGGIYYNNGYVGIGTTSPGTRLKIVEESLPQPLQIESTSQFYTGLNLKNNHDHMNGNVDSWSVLMGTRKSGGYEGLVNGCFAIRQHSPGVDYSRLVIDQDGRVGIGNQSPSRLLHLSGGDALIEAPEWADMTIRTTISGTDAFLALRAATDGVWDNDNYWQIMNKPAHNNDLHFAFNESRKMTLSKEGYLGIGTDQPGSLLDIHGGTRFTVRLNNDTRSKVGNLYSSDDTLALVSFGNVEISIDDNNNSTNKAFRVINNGNSELFRVQDNGNVGVGTSNPAYRFHMKYGDAIIEDTSWCDFKIKATNEGKDPALQLYAGDDYWAFNHDDSEENDLDIRFNNSTKLSIETDGRVGIGTGQPDPSALLQVYSTNKGFLPPRMNSSQIAAIQNPANGLMVYNTSDGHPYVFNTSDYKWKRVAFDSQTITPTFNCGTPFIDPRDGKSYSTVLIGSQCWMAENINIGVMLEFTYTSPTPQQNNGVYEKYCYNNDPINCTTYGGLYDWDEAMNYTTTPGNQGICPPGWHIPTQTEWNNLATSLGGASIAGQKMKTSAGWYNNGNGTNVSGFSGKPAGVSATWGKDELPFWDLSLITEFWNSSDSYSSRQLSYDSNSLIISDGLNWSGYSVRCIKN